MKKILILGFILIVLSSFVHANLQNELVAYYMLNATSGEVIDETGNYDGTNNGATRGVNGKIENAFYFNDSDDNVVIGTGSDFSNLCINGCSFSSWVKYSYDGDNQYIITKYDGNDDKFLRLFVHDENFSRFEVLADGIPANGQCMAQSNEIPQNEWVFISGVYNITHSSIYINGVQENSTACSFAINNTAWEDNQNAYIGCRDLGTTPTIDDTFNGSIDEVGIWSRPLSESEIDYLYNEGDALAYPLTFNAPIISDLMCTSCNIPYGDSTPPYETSDTTPTFTFNTDIQSNCRIGNTNLNYTEMGSERDCDGPDENHTCTLNVDDELIYQDSYVYISCANPNNDNQTEEASIELQMNITDLAMNYSMAILAGIQQSIIWPGASTYIDKEVYLRNSIGNDIYANVNLIAEYGNQRWIINVADENFTPLGLFNMTPSVYVLDLFDTSISEVPDIVSQYVNDTKV